MDKRCTAVLTQFTGVQASGDEKRPRAETHDDSRSVDHTLKHFCPQLYDLQKPKVEMTRVFKDVFTVLVTN